MINFLTFVLLPIMVLAVAIALILGLLAMNKDGEEARTRSNKMMRWRVGLQTATIVLIVIIAVLRATGMGA